MFDKDTNKTVRILALMAFSAWIISSGASGWWIILVVMIIGL